MNAVPFDTLKMAQRLESAGFSGPQAAGAAEALAEALVGADLATKGDLNILGTGLRGDMAALEARMLSAIELLRRDMTIKFGSMMIIAVGVLLAAIRYLPPHP
jgi:hypothetical protein